MGFMAADLKDKVAFCVGMGVGEEWRAGGGDRGKEGLRFRGPWEGVRGLWKQTEEGRVTRPRPSWVTHF